MKKFFILATVLLLSAGAFAQNGSTWIADPAHSSINFTIKHMGISFVPGRFDKFSGTMTSSTSDFSDVSINFTVDVNSINTGVEARDKHLRTADFFEVEKYPTMKFTSTSTKKLSDEKYELKGNLTIKDVTKPVTFDVQFGGVAQDQKGNAKLGFTATSTINRLDYNISYGPQGDVVAKDVDIKLYLEMMQQQ